MSEPAATIPPASRWHTGSWVLYDLANTVFAAAVTYLFVHKVNPASVGVTNSVAMIAAGLVTPVVASMADRTGRAGTYCTIATFGCIFGMALFGAFDSTAALLAVFFAAMICYQAALVFYNSLLPSVASPRNTGLVSGLGVGLGYLGTIFTLVIALPVKTRFGSSAAFLLSAGMFLVCALPCMLLVRDRRPIRRERFSRRLARAQFGELMQTLRGLPKQPALMWFLIGNFCAVDVLNTCILFYGKFVVASFQNAADAGRLALLGRAIGSITRFEMIAGLAVTVPALAYGLLIGCLADRLGSRKAFLISITSLALGLAAAACFAGWAPLLFLIAICLFGGLGLAGIWTAGRKLLIELVPAEQVGRYFGLYGITNKVSVIGSTVFGVMMQARGPRAAILSQVVPLLVAFFCLYKMGKVPGEPPRADAGR